MKEYAGTVGRCSAVFFEKYFALSEIWLAMWDKIAVFSELA